MKYRIASPFFSQEDIDAIVDEVRAILAGDGVLTKGPRVREFEQQFASYTGTTHAVAVNSCTSALEVALHALGIGSGDEVIVPAQTFVSTASAVVSVGARVVFCDTDETFSLSFDDLKWRVTPATKAVIIVHFGGLIHPAIIAIRDFLRERNIALIEDAAHAAGAAMDGIAAGAFGDAGCFSFYATKVMTTGEGGMITTSDETLANACRSMVHIGIDLDADREQFDSIGGNRRMSEIQAILGLSQLRRLDAFVAHRNAVAQVYRDALRPFEQRGIVQLPDVPKVTRHAYWKFILFLREGIDRATLRARMEECGVAIDWPYAPLAHLQPVFRAQYGTAEGMCPNAEARARRHVCLPIHLGISEADARRIAQAFQAAIAQVFEGVRP